MKLTNEPKRMQILKVIALVLGLILAFLTTGWIAYLAYSTPDALQGNAPFILVAVVLAILLILYGQSGD